LISSIAGPCVEAENVGNPKYLSSSSTAVYLSVIFFLFCRCSAYFLARFFSVKIEVTTPPNTPPVTPNIVRIALFIPCVAVEFGSPKQVAQA
jgi:hypothetical protein